jgi:hypothetical protein
VTNGVAWMMALAFAVAGCSTSSSDAPPLSPPGTLDASYGSGGKVILPQASGATDIVVDASGAAYLSSGILVKLDVTGQRVAGFGSSGTLPERSFALAMDASGSLYATSSSGADRVAGVTKLDGNGDLVLTFGNNGTASAGPFALAGSTFANDVQVDSAGSVWGLGTIRTLTADVPSFDAIFVTRLDAQGAPFPGFGTAGRQVLSLPGIPSVVAIAAALDAQGNLVVLGLPEAVNDIFNHRHVLVKVTPTGALLASFGNRGVATLAGCDVFLGSAEIAIDSADNIYVATDCVSNLRDVATVFKLDRNGGPVASFGNAGRKSDVFAMGTTAASAATSLAVDAAGGVYVGGGRAADGVVRCGDFAVAHLDAAGVPVQSFGTGGVVVIDMGAGDLVGALALRGGRLYAAGHSISSCSLSQPGISMAAVVRLVP